MASVGWFRRLQVAGNATVSSEASFTDTVTLSSGIDWPLTTGPSTGTDFILGSHQILITTSDGGYYRLDPPATPGMAIRFVSGGTTASTHIIIPDTTAVLFYTSSGSSGGRAANINGQAGMTFLALTTAQWIVTERFGNIVTSSST